MERELRDLRTSQVELMRERGAIEIERASMDAERAAIDAERVAWTQRLAATGETGDPARLRLSARHRLGVIAHRSPLFRRLRGRPGGQNGS